MGISTVAQISAKTILLFYWWLLGAQQFVMTTETLKLMSHIHLQHQTRSANKQVKKLSQWKSENVHLNTCPHLFLGTSGRYTKSKNKLGNQFYSVNK